MEQSVDLTIRPANADQLPCELAELFWLAQVLTGDDSAAVEFVLEAFESVTTARQTVIEFACHFLSSEIRSATLEVSVAPTPPTISTPLNFETLRIALLDMNLLLRLVWVLCLAEGYSTTEAATLLRVEPSLIRKALTDAVISLAAVFQSPA